MKKIVIPVLGLLLSLTAFADGPTVEERLAKVETDVAFLQKAVAVKPVTKGDVVVSFAANYVSGGMCTSYQFTSRTTKEQVIAKILKVIDCTKEEKVATSYYKRLFYLVQFADGSLGTFADYAITLL